MKRYLYKTLIAPVTTLGLVIGSLAFPAHAASACPFALYGTSSAPSYTGTGTATGYNLGVQFQTHGNVVTNGVRFFPGPSETGPFTVHLDNASGTELASATATAVGTSGWYEGDFSSPVSTPEGSNYVVWRNADNGHDAYLTNGLSSPLDTGGAAYLTGGLYSAQPAGEPSTSTTTSYFISPVVNDTNTPSAPSITADVNATSVTIKASGGYDSGSYGTNSDKVYRNGTQIGTLRGTELVSSDATVDSSVTAGTSYTYSVSAVNYCTTESSTSSSTVTASTEETVLGNSTPASYASTDSNAVEVGMRFSSAVNGTVNGVRFYRNNVNADGYTANLWSNTGTNLATGTVVTDGSLGTGWQEIRFSSPVSITAGTTYVVSYFSDHGHYSYDSNKFSSAVTNGDLTAPADSVSAHNGVYKYTSTSAFPTSSFNKTSYGVDVIFSAGS